MSMNGIIPAAMLAGITKFDGASSDPDKAEKIKQWKKKSWLDFCKMVMEQDKRYTLMPLSDYSMAQGGQGSLLARANGIFSNMCLRRDGEMADVYIVPLDPNLGITIDAGSKYQRMQFSGFPAKSLVWPVLRMADELERQYTREVVIQKNKIGSFAKPATTDTVRKGRKRNVTLARTHTGIANDNKLQTDTETD